MTTVAKNIDYICENKIDNICDEENKLLYVHFSKGNQNIHHQSRV